MSFVLVSSFFFFKQKTAYDMRISDWSSVVCSSDLLVPMLAGPGGICMIDYLPSEPFCNFVEEFPAFNRVGVLRGRYDRRCVHGIRLLVAARPDTVIFHRLGELSDPRRFHRHFVGNDIMGHPRCV